MLIPIVLIFLLISVSGLVFAIKDRQPSALLALQYIWWLVGVGSAFFVYLSRRQSDEDDHWEILYWWLCSFPYCVSVGLLLIVTLLVTCRWRGRRIARVRWSALALLGFIAVQCYFGFVRP